MSAQNKRLENSFKFFSQKIVLLPKIAFNRKHEFYWKMGFEWNKNKNSNEKKLFLREKHNTLANQSLRVCSPLIQTPTHRHRIEIEFNFLIDSITTVREGNTLLIASVNTIFDLLLILLFNNNFNITTHSVLQFFW